MCTLAGPHPGRRGTRVGPCRVCWVCDFVSDISLCHLSWGVLEVKRSH